MWSRFTGFSVSQERNERDVADAAVMPAFRLNIVVIVIASAAPSATIPRATLQRPFLTGRDGGAEEEDRRGALAALLSAAWLVERKFTWNGR